MDNGDELPRWLGAYQIVAEVAHGGMATVYRALQPSLNRFVALKVLSVELSRDPDFVTRFQHEARVAARLEHPNIVPVYDVGQTNGVFYIAMRLVPGRSLAEIIASDGPLSLYRVRDLLTQVASALDYAHRQGVVHRDVKPSNMLVEDNDHLSLADFGIARATDASRVTRFGVLVGTPHFMAPEQVQGLDVDYRADLYSVGVVAYLMLTGRVPFEADSLISVLHKHVYEPPPPARLVRPDLPENIEAALNHMLAKQPGERYPSVSAFVSALHEQRSPEVTLYRPVQPEAVVAQGVQAKQPAAPTSHPASTAKLRKRSGAAWLIGGGVLAIALTGAVVATLARDPGPIVPAVVRDAGPIVGLVGLPTPPAATPTLPGALPGTWEILAGDPSVAGSFNGPAGVAVNQRGEILVTELFNHRIQKLSANGEPLAQWGTFGEGPGQFRDPSAAALDSNGNLYVADKGNDRIQKLAPDGSPLAQWGGSGQLSGPTGVALDAQGNVYVADTGNNRIQKLSPNGQPLQQWGIYGAGPGQFSRPAGVAVDAQGNMYVVDEGNNRIQKLAQDGQPVAQWGTSRDSSSTSDNASQLTFGDPTNVVLDRAGNLLVVDSGTNSIVKLSPTGAKLDEWGEWGDSPGNFELPLGIGLDPQGNIIVADHDTEFRNYRLTVSR